MTKEKLIRRINMKCPACGKTHDVEERIRDTMTVIKGQEVVYKETYLYCSDASEDENEFESGTMMNKNLLNARNAYRIQNGLLTSDEIVKIRESYGMSQVDLARLLGWGEATISRYESKAIQDESYDNTLRLVRENPYQVLEYFNKNIELFSPDKADDIRKKIYERIEIDGREYLSRQTLKVDYILYDTPSDLNGNKALDIDKIEAIISYYASKIDSLHKAKLMRLLWYADAVNYKLYGKSMTGLVYQHKEMGALPVGHRNIVSLDRVNAQEESSADYDLIMHFYPDEHVDYKVMNKKEVEILDKVVERFKTMTTQQIVEYMHDEEAYTQTSEGSYISYEYAKMLRI